MKTRTVKIELELTVPADFDEDDMQNLVDDIANHVEDGYDTEITIDGHTWDDSDEPR